MDITRSSQHLVSMSLPSQTHQIQGNRSFISTSFSNEADNFGMRKSRIQNIPNYRKLGLGDNLPFVVVFQTIEIERLSTEIQSNRIKIKDFERQIFNSQNYEVQIRELTQKLFAIELERTKYSDQVQKLNLICHQLYSELEDMKKKYREVDFTLKDKYEMERAHSQELMQDIERWKVRYTAAEKSKAKELDELRMMMESQRKSMFDREIREITIKFQTERSTLENQIRKFREALEYKNRELEEGRGKLQRLEVQLIEMQSNMNQIAEYENQLVKISQEMLRLNELLRIKQQELEAFAQREFVLNQKLRQQQQWQLQLHSLRANLDNRTREIEEWRIRNSKLEETVARQQDLIHLNNDLNGRILLLQKEVQKYEVVIHSSTSQLQEWKRRYANQQGQVVRLRNQSADIVNFQNKVTVLSTEIQRLNQVMRGKVAELQEWRNKNSKLEITINSFGNLQNDNNELQKRLALQTRSTQQYKHRIVLLEQELTTAKNLEILIQDYNNKIIVLNEEVERLNSVLRGKTQQVEDYKVKYIRIQTQLREYRGVQATIRQYENQLALLTQQVERMNNLLRNKNDEIQRLNVTIRRLQQQNGLLKTNQRRMAESERTIQNLTSKIELHIREAGKWEDKYKMYESRNKQLQGLMFSSNQEREKLSQQLKSKIFETDELKAKFMRVETDAYKMRELEANYVDMKNRLNAVTGELERVERIAREGQAELDRERAFGVEVSFKVIILSAEIERISKSGSGMKGTQVKQLHERFMQLQTACTQKDQQITVILQKVSTLEQQITFLGGELQKFLTAISNYEQHAIALEQDVIKYQDYARRIMILSAEIDRLNGDNKGLEEDIRRLRLRYADQIAAETKHEEFCLKFVMMAIELESLRQRIKDKDVQFDQMRKSILDPVRNIHNSYN